MMFSSKNPLRFVEAEIASRDTSQYAAMSTLVVSGSRLVEPQDQEI